MIIKIYGIKSMSENKKKTLHELMAEDDKKERGKD